MTIGGILPLLSWHLLTNVILSAAKNLKKGRPLGHLSPLDGYLYRGASPASHCPSTGLGFHASWGSEEILRLRRAEPRYASE